MISQVGQDLGLGGVPVAQASPSGSRSLELDLGADAAGVNVSVAVDTAAPVSVSGVQRFGDWTPS